MTLLYFAWVRQKLGTGEECVELPSGVGTLEALAEYLRQRGGPFGEVFSNLQGLRAAVNQEHASWQAAIANDDEVAIFPPVTGG